MVDFIDGATGVPSDQVLQITTHDSLEADDFNALRDTRVNGAPFGITKQGVTPQKIQAGGVPPEQLPGKAIIEGFTWEAGDVDPADRGLAILLANACGKYEITDNTSWRLMQFAASGLASPTNAATYLKLIADTNVLPRMRGLGLRAGGVSLDGTGDNILVSFPMQGSRFDFWGVPTQTTGSGSTLPSAHVDYHEAWDETFTDSLQIQVDAVNGDTITCKAKWSSDGVFGATTFDVVITSGKPARVVHSDGSGALQAERGGLSSFGAPIEISWPPGSTLVATDEFDIPVRRAAPSTSLPAARNIPLINVQLFEDGQQLDADGGFTLDANWSRFEAAPFKGKEQGGSVIRAGVFEPVVNLTRELFNLNWQEALFNRKQISLVIEGRTDAQIPVANRPWLFRTVLPSLRYTGTGFTVTAGGEETEESAVLTGGEAATPFNYDGRNFTAPVTFELETDNAAIP